MPSTKHSLRCGVWAIVLGAIVGVTTLATATEVSGQQQACFAATDQRLKHDKTVGFVGGDLKSNPNYENTMIYGPYFIPGSANWNSGWYTVMWEIAVDRPSEPISTIADLKVSWYDNQNRTGDVTTKRLSVGDVPSDGRFRSISSDSFPIDAVASGGYWQFDVISHKGANIRVRMICMKPRPQD